MLHVVNQAQTMAALTQHSVGHGRLRLWCALVVFVTLASQVSLARSQSEQPPTVNVAASQGAKTHSDTETAQTLTPSAWAIAASIVPGILVHGSGHFVAGDRATARRLLFAEGIGIAAIGLSGATLALSGANRHLSTPSIIGLVGGVGLFLSSWVADIYGASGGGGRAWHSLDPARFAIEAGHMGVSDPQFAYSQFVRLAARYRTGPWTVGGLGWVAADADNRRFRGELAYRFLDHRDSDGRRRSRFGIRAAITRHRFGDDRFSVTTTEAAAGGRLDLRWLSHSLDGAFFDYELGLALEALDYAAASATTDLSRVLLARFAPGFYYGDGGPLTGEVFAYYLHRRDGFRGGLSPGRGQGSGFAGSFGLGAITNINEHVALTADVSIGSALVVETGLRFSLGR